MKKILFALAVLFIIALIILFFYLFAQFQTPGSGQHTGYVTAVEKSGIILQTWTAYVKTDPQSSQEDAYCVTDPRTIADLQNDEQGRVPITVYYSSPFIVWTWQCDHPASIINSVSAASATTTLY